MSSVGGQKVTVEMPKINVDHLMQGNWNVGLCECLTNPPNCNDFASPGL